MQADPEFYLNHMGYKELKPPHPAKRSIAFYLNHMGYKVFMEYMERKDGKVFYLNHMGYKEHRLYGNKPLCRCFI